MNRREVLSAGGAALAGLLAGCGDGGAAEPTPTETESEAVAGLEHPGTLEETFVANGEYPADMDSADGYPPMWGEPPAGPDADPATFDTVEVNGETVRLAPVDVVYAWYRRGEARFVDARGLGQYREAHVYGAVNSPAVRESKGGPVPGWPTGERVVTYCACPHHLSSIRAAGLQRSGYAEVYALDDGFSHTDTSWAAHDYPMAGTAFAEGNDTEVRAVRIAGRVDPHHAGEFVWVVAGRQYEAGPVADNGQYELTLAAHGLSPDTTVDILTPAGARSTRLGDLPDLAE